MKKVRNRRVRLHIIAACRPYEFFHDMLPFSRSSGHKFTISFDEATFVGRDRYLTLNLHHNGPIFGTSKTAPLGLLRVDRRATGDFLTEMISGRLQSFGLSKDHILAATTDGGSNVLRAVRLIGLKSQKCLAHGLDLVVRKALFGDKPMAFDVSIFDTEDDPDKEVDDFLEGTEESDEEGVERSDDGEVSESDVEEVANSDVETVADSDEETVADSDEETADSSLATGVRANRNVTVGDVIKRIRRVARNFRKRPLLMDEVRKITARKEYNGKELTVKLDCKTRWYSTFLMIERALRILPAINNVLSRHGTPIDANDSHALKKVMSALAPFKRAILVLCESKTTLSHADKILSLLLNELGIIGTELADCLRANLVKEIRKRRTILSTVLSVLENPQYDFSLELDLGLPQPSDGRILDVLEEILRADDLTPIPDSEHEAPPKVRSSFSLMLRRIEFVCTIDISLIEILALQPPLTWDTVFCDSVDTAAQGRMPLRQNLQMELALHKAKCGRGLLLERCRACLVAIPPSSVQPERDFSDVRQLIGERRARLGSETLNNIFFLRRAFQHGAI